MSDAFNFALARELANAVTSARSVRAENLEILSFAEAKRAAWEDTFQVAQESMDVLMNTKGYEPRLGWTDLREHMVGRELRGPVYRALVRTEPPLIESVFSELHPILATSEEAIEVMDDVVADIYHSVLSRHIHGPGHYFLEQVLSAYRDGFWPCGWRGSFPLVELMAYRFQK
jgi:hypothetical protein